MKKSFALIISLLFVLQVTQIAVAEPSTTNITSKLERKIITFKPSFGGKNDKENIIKKYNGEKIKSLDLINAVSVLLPQNNDKKILYEDCILRIDDDSMVTTLGKTSVIPQPAEVLPWGVERIHADRVYPTTTADLVKIAIIDTGIDLSHPDLKNNIKGSYNAISNKNSVNDDNGHGTHVAGIIAAEKNSIGVVGVAPQVDLYIVKALGSNASGYISDIIESLDWVIKNNIKVVNMSFGISSDNQALHDAVIRASKAGVVQVAAAGNDYSKTTWYPASYPEVISVSAIDSNEYIASFSSTGKVDLVAPGDNIYSTYKGQYYANMSGTSMATPHVTGAVALLLSMPSKCDANNDGICSQDEVLKSKR